jgi:hypothetical protein
MVKLFTRQKVFIIQPKEQKHPKDKAKNEAKT